MLSLKQLKLYNNNNLNKIFNFLLLNILLKKLVDLKVKIGSTIEKIECSDSIN